MLGATPYFVNFGREMALEGSRRYIESLGEQERINCEERAKRLEEIRSSVRVRLEEASVKLARNYNLRRRDVQYMPGELVWRKNFVLSDAANYYAAKLAPKYIGPL